jgi:CheY-like chemotaxis protein/tRNA A-37 threonylcarbamoyl transferase component Bud32
MANLDAAPLALEAVRLGLLTQEQVNEAWEELGARGGDPEEFLRIMERKGYLTPWQSSKLLKGERDGYFLGGYRILYKIASGSFGRVYRADDPRTGNVVAIKVLRRKWSEDKHNIDLFAREGKLGMSLHHPNLVEILAVNRDTASRQYYIVMEFVEGGNLRDFLTIRKKLEPAEALRILEDAAAALTYAFSRALTHRDMKLTNILISSTGTAKLVDFGLGEVIHGGQREKDDGVLADRTVDYAGLEKATGVPHGDTRSDIYFLGCVAYEMLTGRPPLEMTRDPRARMRENRFRRVQPMTRDEVNAPPSVFRLIETMMSLNPHERFQTPSQLLEAIRKVRRELEGKAVGNGARPARSLFVVERDQRLQDTLREKLKERGYRVLLAVDPARALDRYRQQPYDALVVDVGTTGEEGLLVFEAVMSQAGRDQHPCAGVVILSKSQADWVGKVEARPTVAVLVQPVTLKQLLRTLDELWSLKAG